VTERHFPRYLRYSLAEFENWPQMPGQTVRLQSIATESESGFEVAGPDSVGRRAAFRGSAYCKRTDYPAAATWIDRYFLAGGADLSMRSLLAQAYFQNNDIANCIK
jgi:hypothetical protein